MALRARWRPGDDFLVRHKDAEVIVVEKRASLLTHTGAGQDEPSLLSGLRSFLGDRDRGRLKAAHRLDRVVSGLLVFSRTETAFDALKAQFAMRTVERRYLAGVHGIPDHDEGRLEDHLDVEPLTVRVVGREHPSARKAITRYEVREPFPRARAALLEVRLETGLRNQIRVQLAAAGLPLLGERKYHPSRPRAQGHERIFLHAAVLGFLHPRTGAELRFEAPLPPDLRRWAQELRRGACAHAPPATTRRRR